MEGVEVFMRKILMAMLIIFMFGSILSGCVKEKNNLPKDDIKVEEPDSSESVDEDTQNQITSTIKIFYGDATNEKIVSEDREITYSKDEDKYRVALEELIKGAKNTNFTSNINNDTKVLDTSIQGKDLVVNLSREFNSFAGSVAQIIAVGGVVNTMTQFDEVERVKILIEGEEFIGPSGQPRGFMEPFVSDPGQVVNKEVTLYFGDENATFVVGERRVINMNAHISQEDFIKVILEELILGPTQEGLSPTIPPNTKILTVKVENNIASINFSEEMHTNHWGGAAGEAMTIGSIVNTLTELNDIKKVKITVENEPLAIEHTVLEEPVSRNEEIIQR